MRLRGSRDWTNARARIVAIARQVLPVSVERFVARGQGPPPACSMPSTPFESLDRRWSSHLPTRTPRNAGRRGRRGSAGVVRAQGTKRPSLRTADYRLQGRGGRDCLSQSGKDPRRCMPARQGRGLVPGLTRGLLRICAKTICGLGRSCHAEIEPTQRTHRIFSSMLDHGYNDTSVMCF